MQWSDPKFVCFMFVCGMVLGSALTMFVTSVMYDHDEKTGMDIL